MRLTELGTVPQRRKIQHPPAPQGARLAQIAEFGENPGALEMFAYLPPGLPKGAALVVMLHGCSQTAAGYDLGSGWSALADRLGFAVLAPQQRMGNNPQGCFNWFQPGDTARDMGEAASIRQMIAHLVHRHGLDTSRIFITGLSAGGAMTSAMLAAYPEIFAGGAIIAGLPHGAAGNVYEALNAMRQVGSRTPAAWGDAVRAASPHKGPWPRVAIWHGDADEVVAPANAEALVHQWTDVHGLTAAPQDEKIGRHRRRRWTAKDGKDGVVLEVWNLAGLRHGVPLAAAELGVPGSFMLEAGLSATLHIAAFWGLADGAAKAKPAPVRAAASAARVAPREPAPVLVADAAPQPDAEPKLTIKIRQTIDKALRAAGLVP